MKLQPIALSTAALMLGGTLTQPASDEQHLHHEREGEEISVPVGWGFSGTNVSAQIITSGPTFTWVMPSSGPTFLHDLDVTARLRQAGINVYLWIAPTASSGP